jgi:hypothetical protein
MIWSVWQTGGRRHSYWHVIFRGLEARARAEFELAKKSMKSGAIKLVDHNDRVIDRAQTGRARAR